MTRRSKLTALAIFILAAGGIAAFAAFGRREKPVEVRIEEVAHHDLVSSVTATGYVQPQALVDLSSEITGKVVELAVKEGQSVRKGQLLMRIDQTQFLVAVQRAEAGLASAKSSLAQSAADARLARQSLEREENIARSNAALVSAERLEQLRTQVDVTAAREEASKAAVAQAEGGVEDAKSALAKTVVTSPMDGTVTRLNIKEGETAIVGTMNRAAAILLTIADMHRLQTLVRVSESDITSIRVGDSVVVEIDAFRDTTFQGTVIEIANSSAAATGTATGDISVSYLVKVALDNAPAETRMDYSALAKIITDKRERVLAVPIVALAVRELDSVATEETAQRPPGAAPPRTVGRVDREGVFIVGPDNKVTFRPVKVGIASDRHFEVLGGLEAGERIVAGTYQAIRTLRDGMLVRQSATDSLKTKGGNR